ncbi:hypothetical protein CTAYLR_004818 [Chrysophaeum taylorii]|uniref:PNPLA domain-containing protein n=1 Tax=Chrysophaeum taylorii TaxID=2483200 RepID=A0AAD7UQ44_9STRA|nr:hypothetical protein CTAYLR_004818 [Chrysophaeum taylorii]
MGLQETGSPSVDTALSAAIRVNAYCRERGTARFNLRAPLEKELSELLDDDAATRLNERDGDVGIAVTRFAPLPRGELVTTFSDADDVRTALLASSCIPFYFGRSPFVSFRRLPTIDGFFAVPRQYFGAPPALNASVTVRISPFEASRVGLVGEAISPQRGEGPPLGDLVACALGSPPVGDDFLLYLFQQGRRDAASWLETSSKKCNGGEVLS